MKLDDLAPGKSRPLGLSLGAGCFGTDSGRGLRHTGGLRQRRAGRFHGRNHGPHEGAESGLAVTAMRIPNDMIGALRCRRHRLCAAVLPCSDRHQLTRCWRRSLKNIGLKAMIYHVWTLIRQQIRISVRVSSVNEPADAPTAVDWIRERRELEEREGKDIRRNALRLAERASHQLGEPFSNSPSDL